MTIADYNGMTFAGREEFWKQKNVDGIVNLDLYRTAKPKILFIAHEPRIEKVSDLSRFSLSFLIDNYRKYPTLIKSAEIACKVFDTDNKKDALSRIAWINVKKQPRICTSKENRIEIDEALQLNQDFLFKQIAEIKPDIIFAYNVIYGENSLWNPWLSKRNSLLLFLEPKDKSVAKVLEESDIDVYVEEKTKMLVIDTYHPAAICDFPIDVAYKAVQCYQSGDYKLLTEWKSRRER